MSDHTIYAMDDFERQRPIVSSVAQDEKLADRIAKRHRVCARWNENDEIVFYHPDEGEEHGMKKENV